MKSLRIFPISMVLLLLLSTALISSDYKAYVVYESDGVEADFADLVDEALDADIIFFGEMHNNPICHWLQIELTKALYEEKKEGLVLGAEMFEADDQLKINEYLSGKIKRKNFEKEAKLWSNYKTDYKPLMRFAKKNELEFIATNIPRRYAALVAKDGFEALESLAPEAKAFIPPLPIEVDLNLPGYKKMEAMGGHSTDSKKMPKMGEMTEEQKSAMMKKMQEAMKKVKFLKQAQASKDATMAHFILKNFSKGKTFLHFNGTYHTNNFEGIVWFIKKAMPDLKIMTIASVEQNNTDKLDKDNNDLADYILVIPEDMTKTY